MQKRSLFCLGLAIASLPAGQARASDAADYVSAFGREEIQGDDAAAPTEPVVQEDARAALQGVGSFPVRVRRGDKPGLDWSDAAQRNYTPKKVVKRFKAGGCAFKVTTGDLGLTRYEFREDTHEVAVNQDPVLRFSTLEVSATQGLLVSINAELGVEPLKGYEAACKEKFSGRRVRFGKADMDLSELALLKEGEAQPDETAGIYMEQKETPVYLTWDEEAGSLALVGKGGLPASVQSSVFLVKPRSEGDYYLTVSPKLAIARAKKH